MTLLDDVHAAARTLAQLTHMNQTAAMSILDLLVHMDVQALAAVPEEDRNAVGSFPVMITALCRSELALGSEVCAAWQTMSDTSEPGARRS